MSTPYRSDAASAWCMEAGVDACVPEDEALPIDLNRSILHRPNGIVGGVLQCSRG
jgi:hypothetical protein